ncbi:MAG TPA: ADP-ribosylglycohydrolase family protein [Tepidisphaeraceae bacterium]|nr:ADP-ribosylglycohydrolase family protein [Tepidisphaeraceae bacterium]
MDHNDRMAAARRSLDGLSVGDAFGECFFPLATDPLSWELHLSTRTLPNWRWRWTDDSAMAVSIVEVLDRQGVIDQDDLAQTFARRYAWDDRRGYGGTAHGILMAIGAGGDWREVSPAVLSGMGSMGNGGAMRAAPIGAHFATDGPSIVAEQARLSAEVTHAHPDGQAGAVGVALAAAWVALNPGAGVDAWDALFDYVLAHMPDCQTRARVAQARAMGPKMSAQTVVAAVGNGSGIIAPDTVPFCIWNAARCLGQFEEAMWTTVEAGGDMDTTCAIVGGIIAAEERGAPPAEWLARREPLPDPV